MAKEILQKENPVLREKSKKVPVEQITSPEIKEVIKDMETALDSKEDGVAIAAPQIGALWQIFIVSKKIFKDKENPKNLIFVNPEIISQSKEALEMDEGCLSCSNLYGAVERKEKTKVRAFDEKGQKFEYGGSGLLSQIFQHEIDHLNGILFIDKAKKVVEIKPDEKE